ncbi:hypothetical protein [Nocardia aurea]|uniref:hypothetical protein n=1 Tax=Nocardia aurea TaxID=2144174 RepID=UPI0033A7A69B
MSNYHAEVDAAVFEFLRPELKRYEERAEQMRRNVAAAVAGTERDTENEVTERRRALQRAEQELAACLAGSGECEAYRREVVRRRRMLEYALEARRIVQRAVELFRVAQRRYSDTVTTTLDDGRRIVATASDRIERYQKRSASVTSAIPTGSRSASGTGSITVSGAVAVGIVVPDCYPQGFAEIPIAVIATGDTVTGAEDFDTGQSMADLRWAVEALYQVVLPAMRTFPHPQPYLRDRDIAEQRTGDACYLRTYEGFFGSRAITLSRGADGTFDVVNGHHRLWIMRQAGETSIPARVTGGWP